MKRYAWLAATALIAAAAPQDAPTPFARATLNVQQGGTRAEADGKITGGSFALVDRIEVPENHVIHDGLIAFEGPGWESDRVAYRLYLDERNVPDIFGKKLPAPILPHIGMGKDDYHVDAPWGMDIFQVNQSLGVGGIGRQEGDRAVQLGPSRITASIDNAGDGAAVRVTNRGVAASGGKTDLTTTYRIEPGSRLTHVKAAQAGPVTMPLVAGLTWHPGTTVVSGKAGKWRFVGTWGVQSLAKDGLGIVLFYREDDVAAVEGGGGSIWLRFCDPRQLNYAFAAAWIQEPGAPQSAIAFTGWAGREAAALDKADAAPSHAGCWTGKAAPDPANAPSR